MNDIQYMQTQKELIEVVEALYRLDLQAFIQRIETAHATGPILNPTLYRLGMESMDKIQRLASAAQYMVGVWFVDAKALGVAR